MYEIGRERIQLGDLELDVIIPIRSLQINTFFPMVKTINNHPRISYIYIMVDPDMESTDLLKLEILHEMCGNVIILDGARGKGQNVLCGVKYIGTERILFCDADYIGLQKEHLDIMTGSESGMIIGIPDYPYQVPSHVIHSWQFVSGFRALPREIIPDNLHGYLMETQINKAAEKFGIIVDYVLMKGLISPFQWPLPEWRMKALEEDAQWGLENGVLP
jgi:hypothetical protein